MVVAYRRLECTPWSSHLPVLESEPSARWLRPASFPVKPFYHKLTVGQKFLNFYANRRTALVDNDGD